MNRNSISHLFSATYITEKKNSETIKTLWGNPERPWGWHYGTEEALKDPENGTVGTVDIVRVPEEFSLMRKNRH